MHSFKLLRIQILTERFLAKAGRKNDPLEAYRKTDNYLHFQKAFEVAVRKQIIFASTHLNDMKIFDNDDLPQHQLEARIGTYLDRYMPQMADMIAAETVKNNLVSAFEWAVRASYKRIGAKLLRKYLKSTLTKDERPSHQKELEDAHNNQDYQRVVEILDAMDPNDPYKQSMESFFADDRKKAALQSKTGYDSSTQDYTVDFTLTNQHYIDALNNEADYLLNTKSKGYDQTTKDRLITIVRDGRLQRKTIDEVASDLNDQVDSISSVRAFMIANTETANAFGTANQAFLTENNVEEKSWVIAGPHNLTDECDDNEAASPIPVGDEFPSGDMHEPAHTNCECYTQAEGMDLTTMSDDELQSLVLWDGS